jgi:NAD(P)H-nitrite reductase large subunit
MDRVIDQNMAKTERDLETTICFCHNVRLGTLLKAIEEGAQTVEQIQEKTKASTGCGGCESEVLEIITETVEKQGKTSKT